MRQCHLQVAERHDNPQSTGGPTLPCLTAKGLSARSSICVFFSVSSPAADRVRLLVHFCEIHWSMTGESKPFGLVTCNVAG